MLLLVVAGVAQAQPDPFEQRRGASELAADLFTEARRLIQEGKLTEACKKFEASFGLEDALGTQLNVADCWERQGRLLEAFHEFDLITRRAFSRGDTNRLAFARERRTALQARLAVIEIELTEPVASSTVVKLDGIPLGPATPKYVLPKEYVLEARAATQERVSTRITLRPGERRKFSIPSLAEPPSRRRKSWIYASAAVAGAGALTTIAGVVLRSDTDPLDGTACTLTVYDTYACPSDAQYEALRANMKDAERNTIASNIAIGSGITVIFAGIIVFAVAPRDRVRVTASVSSQTAGLELTF